MLSSSWHLRPFSRNRHGRKFEVGELGGGPHLTYAHTIPPGPMPIAPYQVASSSIKPFGQIWPKIGRLCPLLGGGRSPSNTMWPAPRPTCMPSGNCGILIPPTVCHNRPTSQTGQDRQTDNGPIRHGRPKILMKIVLSTAATKISLLGFDTVKLWTVSRFTYLSHVALCFSYACKWGVNHSMENMQIFANLVAACAKRLHRKKYCVVATLPQHNIFFKK